MFNKWLVVVIVKSRLLSFRLFVLPCVGNDCGVLKVSHQAWGTDPNQHMHPLKFSCTIQTQKGPRRRLLPSQMASWTEQGWPTAVVIARCFCREVRERGMGTWCFRHHSLSDVPFKTGGKQMVMRRGPRLKGFHGINGIEGETSNLLYRPRLNSSSFPVQRKQAEGSSRLSPFWRNSYFQSF